MKRLNFVSLKSLQLQKVLLPPATSSIGLAGLAIPSPVDFLNTKPDVCSCTPVTDLVLALHATHLRAKCLHLHTELVTAPGRKAQKNTATPRFHSPLASFRFCKGVFGWLSCELSNPSLLTWVRTMERESQESRTNCFSIAWFVLYIILYYKY